MASIARGEYCVSKAGLAMAARLFAVRLAPLGIPVFEVRPGIIATDMTAGVRETYDAGSRTASFPSGAGDNLKTSAGPWPPCCAATFPTRPAPSCTSTVG